MSDEKKQTPEDLERFLQEKMGNTIKIDLKAHAQQEEEDTRAAENKRNEALEFDYKPREIKEYLDRFVIRQEDAKKVLSTAICDHYHHIQNCRTEDDWRDYKKQNIVLIGPTGVGKTYLIQNIARLIGVPFVKADATKYSETGYVGGDVEDLIRELVNQAGGDIELAEYGIVYVDEIDKIASSGNSWGKDVSGHGVQRNLLKLMEETEVPLKSAQDVIGQMQSLIQFQTKGKVDKKTINTRNILFIVSGAFNGLTEVIRKRIGSKQIGFMQEKTGFKQEDLLLDRVRSVDMIQYGFEAEFAGRLPVVVHCTHLSSEDLFNIMKYSEGSILKQYKRDFLSYGIDIYFTDDGMKALAVKAAGEKTGARGLMTVCERIFRDFKYFLPDSEVKAFVVTDKLIADRETTLNDLLTDPGRDAGWVLQWKFKKISKILKKEFGVALKFEKGAAKYLWDLAAEQEEDLADFSEKYFREFEHALILLAGEGSESEYVLDGENIKALGDTLEKWIKENYKDKKD
jgi:ATP-dependent Clp protease ATP-binding subunit ClpX